MWWKIAKLAGLFFLGFGAAQDIKYQKISTEYLEMVTGGNRVRRQLDDPEYG